MYFENQVRKDNYALLPRTDGLSLKAEPESARQAIDRRFPSIARIRGITMGQDSGTM